MNALSVVNGRLFDHFAWHLRRRQLPDCKSTIGGRHLPVDGERTMSELSGHHYSPPGTYYYRFAIGPVAAHPVSLRPCVLHPKPVFGLAIAYAVDLIYWMMRQSYFADETIDWWMVDAATFDFYLDRRIVDSLTIRGYCVNLDAAVVVVVVAAVVGWNRVRHSFRYYLREVLAAPPQFVALPAYSVYPLLGSVEDVRYDQIDDDYLTRAHSPTNPTNYQLLNAKMMMILP